MPTYEKRPGGVIRAKIRVEPFPAESKTFGRKVDARLWAEPREAELKKKKRAGLLEEERFSYADLIDDYMATELENRGSDRKWFKQKALWWHAEIGRKTLAEVRTLDIGQIRDKLLKESLYSVDVNGEAIGRVDKNTGKVKRKRPATVKKYLSVLSAMCRYNINERGWLRSNPVLALSNSKKVKCTRPRVRFLSEKEKLTLLSACEESQNKTLYVVVLFGLCTGARKNEILGLRLGDMNADMTKAILEDTKNGDSRTVHIPPVLRECLMTHREMLDAFYDKVETENYWLFPREDGQAPINIRKAWEQARKQAIKEAPTLNDFRFHDLRHTFASYLAMAGATVIQLKEALGHRTLKAVERYAHLTEDHTEELVLGMAKKRFAA